MHEQSIQAMPVGRKDKLKSLSAGRPKSFATEKNSTHKTSSKRGRALIRRYHTLSKEHAQAVAAGDTPAAAALLSQIEAQGGISAYQDASRAGQSAQRGGDTSRVLVNWVREHNTASMDFRMLEVGALAVENACAQSGLFQMTRIDLHSGMSGILQQDFMERPLPADDRDRFDCISLSLVVNYVPDPGSRGAMLRRVLQFLRSKSASGALLFPSLFLVLPAPCLENSRYLNKQRLASIMDSLGFTLAKEKLSAKLVYQLWVLDHDSNHKLRFPKMEVSPGKTRNNFAIVLT